MNGADLTPWIFPRMNSSNPLIVQSDFTVLLEVESPRFEEARTQLARFAELVKMPEHIHTYRITPISLWNAAAAGLAADAIVAALKDLAKYPPPAPLLTQLCEIAGRFGILQLRRHVDGCLALHSMRPTLAEEIVRHPDVQKYLGQRLDASSFLVETPWRGPLKRALIRIGWPVEDAAGFEDAPALPMSLCSQLPSGKPFQLRDYQRNAVAAFQNGLGGGVVLLPCGGGKTLVGMGCMANLQQHTLILTTSVSAVRQWKKELLEKTSLTEDLIGEYSGQKKEIKPVTIATYQILTLTRQSSDLAPDTETEFRHFALFGERPWGLIVFDEVHQLPAHLFQAAASVQSRRRLGLTATLIREDGMEGDVFALVGPKLYDAPWRDLERAGWIAPAVCVEIRVPVSDADLLEYATASKREQPAVAAANPAKNAWVKALLARHPDVPTLIIGTYLHGLKALSKELGIPMLDGAASQQKRDALFESFRRGETRVLIVSRIANTSIDLPDATVAIQISGQFGSRQEEAQRLGRVLRPKEDGRQAFFYTLVSRDTVEQDFALKRQMFLCEQGYAYQLHVASETDLLPHP